MGVASASLSAYSGGSSVVGNGWFNTADTIGAYASVEGCTYLDPYSGVGAATPTAACTGAAARRMARAVRPTPAPKQ